MGLCFGQWSVSTGGRELSSSPGTGTSTAVAVSDHEVALEYRPSQQGAGQTEPGPLTACGSRTTHLDTKENSNPGLLPPWLSRASCHCAFPLTDSLLRSRCTIFFRTTG